jgi:signal transduction histidine kinase
MYSRPSLTELVLRNPYYLLLLATEPLISVTGLAYLTIALLALCIMTVCLGLLLRVTNKRRLTVRLWLAIVWVGAVVLPLFAEVLFLVAYQTLQQVTASDFYHLGPEQLVAAEVTIPLLAFAVTFVALAWLTGRMVIRPLSAMRRAAQQVARGDLQISMPPLQLREVAEVAEALHTMGDALETSIKRQAEIEQERRFFISAIAHDLRTPLFTLRGYLEGLEQGIAETPESTARYIAICQDQAGVLERLIEDLFSYARLEYLGQNPVHEPLDLGALLRKSLGAFEAPARIGKVTLLLNGPADPCLLEGDAHLLMRALQNILDNALRFAPPGGTVQVRWRREGGLCVFAVTDSGPGFSSDALTSHSSVAAYGLTGKDQTRDHVDSNGAPHGAGLGLVIAQRILAAHGGGLIATNSLVGGAEVIGFVPAPPAMDIPGEAAQG